MADRYRNIHAVRVEAVTKRVNAVNQLQRFLKDEALVRDRILRSIK